MSNLRDILIHHQYDIVLKEHFGNEYPSVSDEEKQSIISLVAFQVAHDVDLILNQYIEYAKLISPKEQNNIKVDIIFTVINVLLTIAIAYSVNVEAWIFVTFFAVLSIVSYSAPLVIKIK